MEIKRQASFDRVMNGSALSVSHSGFVRTDETWHQEPLYAPYSRLYYVLEGAGVLFSESEEMLLEPGYVYLAPCGMKYGFYGKDSVTKLFFHVQISNAPDNADAFAGCNRFIRLPYDVKAIKELKRCYLSQDLVSHLSLKGALYQTVGEALTLARQGMPQTQIGSPLVANAITYIRAHLQAGLTVREIADALFCSRSKLSALFHEEVGQSVAKYIDDLLMSEAQTMLLYSNRTVGEISEQLGFCDQFYFSRRFTKRFSVAPSRFRKSMSEK
ncbi:MAG: helix-turn-helix transcriptional regulator [Clostridia bacterium]|nr:helix-turn-helix transcriptional regulator [Clostridia bacterium]